MIDLNSTKGTYIDTGSGWSRLAQSVAAVLPRGGRVRLGECSTLLVFPHEGVAPAPPVTERERADDIPRFSSLVQSKVIVSNGAGSAKTDGEGGGGGKIEGGGAGSQEGGEGGESRSAPARLPGVDEQPSSWESLAAAHARAVDEGESDEVIYQYTGEGSPTPNKYALDEIYPEKFDDAAGQPSKTLFAKNARMRMVEYFPEKMVQGYLGSESDELMYGAEFGGQDGCREVSDARE